MYFECYWFFFFKFGIDRFCPLITRRVYFSLSGESFSLLCCPLFLGKTPTDAVLQEFVGRPIFKLFMTWMSISWKLMADTDIKLLWKQNWVLQIVALTDGIQRQDVVLHTYYLVMLRIIWRWCSEIYFFFSISPQVGNVMDLFRKKNFSLLLCQFMVLWLTSLWYWQSA